MSSSIQSPEMIAPPSLDEGIPRFLLPAPGRPERQRKGWSLAFSLSVQIVGVLLLLWLARLLPPRARFLYPESQRHWTIVRLEAPDIQPIRPPRARVIPPRLPARLPQVVFPATPRSGPQPRLDPPAPISVPAPRPGPSQPVELHHPVEAAPPVLKPALKIQPPKVQVGSFGDPAGVAAPATTEAVNAPRFGAFDSGDAAHAAVAPPSRPQTGGFASLDGPTSPGGHFSQDPIRVNSFDAAPAAGHLQLLHPAPVPPRPLVRLPVVLSHPLPAYTALAQRNRVEGEVVLEAVLQRDGSVRVLRVVQGLGYGLDQSARDAAHKLRFRPALRDGQPVDWTVLLHITFRLAY